VIEIPRPKTVLIRIVQGMLALLAVGALVFLLWEPHVEGRNRNATLYQIYFQDLFLAYVYLSSIPFFYGLFQTIRALGQICDQTEVSPAGISTLHAIKRCAWFVIGAAVLSLLFMLEGDPEDRPPGLALRLFVILPSIVVAVLAAKYERSLQARWETQSAVERPI